jgi:predicted RNA-binding Zn-ribbon protein involved in translation (DUF1610 family)
MKVSVEESAVKCDNPACGFEQAIPFEDHEKWIDRPCPNCGENLITREDFEKSQALYDLLNDPLWEELEEKAIADFSRYSKENPHGRPGWYLAKPVPGPFIWRLRDAWRVLMGRSFACHYYADYLKEAHKLRGVVEKEAGNENNDNT